MRTDLQDVAGESPLWQVVGVGEEHITRRQARDYWWHNADRRPPGQVVVQITLAGELLIEEHNRRHSVPPGHAVLFVFGDDSAYGCDPDRPAAYCGRYIGLHGAGLPQHWTWLRRRYGSVLEIGDDPDLDRLFADLAAVKAMDDPEHVWPMARLVQDLVVYLFRRAQRDRLRRQTPVERAIDHVLSMPTTSLSVKEIAARHDVSPEHLGRCFARQTGEPPAAWLRRARLQRAVSLLRNTDLLVHDVARLSGFSSAHHLARVLRAEKNATPGALRRRRPRGN